MTKKLALEGKTAVVTGATAGIGLAVVSQFAREGCFVIGVGRSAQKCRDALQEVRRDAETLPPHYLLADLRKLTDVRRLGVEIGKVLQERHRTCLDVLVNNAGTYADHFQLTADGLETTLAVNHFSGFLLAHECMPLLARSPEACILTTSSNSHYRTSFRIDQVNTPRGYRFGLWAYKVSKLMNVLFTLEFNRRHGGGRVTAYAVDPGLVNTEIGFKNTAWYSRFVWLFRHHLGTSPELPARTFAYLAAGGGRGHPGEYYWKNLEPQKPNPRAVDERLGTALWQLSKTCCGITDDF